MRIPRRSGCPARYSLTSVVSAWKSSAASAERLCGELRLVLPGSSNGSSLWSLPSISEQYMKFEFTSLRHAVSTAEKLCFIAREISEKGRLFAVFATQTGPERSEEHTSELQSLR